MSLLVKGMDMPKSCFYCPFREKVNPDDYVCMALNKEFEETFSLIVGKRHDDCPLVSVPPHGRFIDADELIEKQKEDAEIFMGSTNYGDKVRYDEAMNAVANIVNAPTVIPADKDGEV